MVDNNMDVREGTSRRTVIQTVGAGAIATGLAGCGDVISSGDDDVVIGHLAPHDNPLGVGSLRTAEMALENIGAEINGEDVEVVNADTRTEPSEAQTVAEELIQQDDADVLVGVFQSEVARALIELTTEFDVPFLTTGTADTGISTEFPGEDYERYKNWFRVGPINTDFQSEAMADHAEQLYDLHGWEDVAFLRDNAAWTEPFARLVPDYLEERGMNVVMEDAITIENPDLSAVVSDVVDSGADYVMRFFAHIDGGEMLGIWHEAEHEFGIEGIHVNGMLPAYYALSEGASLYESTAQTGGGGVARVTEKTAPFVQEYAERYEGEDQPTGAPMYMGFATYDAIHVVAEVLEEIGSTNPRDDLDEFVDAMVDLEYTGVAGPVSFYGEGAEFPNDLQEMRNPNGDIMNFPITQWREGGEIECVFPPEFETAEHVKPHWMR